MGAGVSVGVVASDDHQPVQVEVRTGRLSLGQNVYYVFLGAMSDIRPSSDQGDTNFLFFESWLGIFENQIRQGPLAHQNILGIFLRVRNLDRFRIKKPGRGIW